MLASSIGLEDTPLESKLFCVDIRFCLLLYFPWRGILDQIGLHVYFSSCRTGGYGAIEATVSRWVKKQGLKKPYNSADEKLWSVGIRTEEATENRRRFKMESVPKSKICRKSDVFC